nr:immunoglobulin heavy chain junction region [Macaca mulatta]
CARGGLYGDIIYYGLHSW